MGGNAFIIMLVIGILMGGFGMKGLSSLNPFKAGKVAITKQESHKEEYFRDKVKGIEYRMTSKNKAQAPAKRTLSQSIGDFVATFWKMLIAIGVVSLGIFWLTGINVVKKMRELIKSRNSHRKLNHQLVVGTQNAKKKMNGEQETLSTELGNALDEDSKKLVREIKSEKSI